MEEGLEIMALPTDQIASPFSLKTLMNLLVF